MAYVSQTLRLEALTIYFLVTGENHEVVYASMRDSAIPNSYVHVSPIRPLWEFYFKRRKTGNEFVFSQIMNLDP